MRKPILELTAEDLAITPHELYIKMLAFEFNQACLELAALPNPPMLAIANVIINHNLRRRRLA
jgi:hypothetical protein